MQPAVRAIKLIGPWAIWCEPKILPGRQLQQLQYSLELRPFGATSEPLLTLDPLYMVPQDRGFSEIRQLSTGRAVTQQDAAGPVELPPNVSAIFHRGPRVFLQYIAAVLTTAFPTKVRCRKFARISQPSALLMDDSVDILRLPHEVFKQLTERLQAWPQPVSLRGPGDKPCSHTCIMRRIRLCRRQFGTSQTNSRPIVLLCP